MDKSELLVLGKLTMEQKRILFVKMMFEAMGVGNDYHQKPSKEQQNEVRTQLNRMSPAQLDDFLSHYHTWSEYKESDFYDVVDVLSK